MEYSSFLSFYYSYAKKPPNKVQTQKKGEVRETSPLIEVIEFTSDGGDISTCFLAKLPPFFVLWLQT